MAKRLTKRVGGGRNPQTPRRKTGSAARDANIKKAQEFAAEVARKSGKTVTLRTTAGGSDVETITKITRKGKVSRSRTRKLAAPSGSIAEKRAMVETQAVSIQPQGAKRRITYTDTKTGQTFKRQPGQSLERALIQSRLQVQREQFQRLKQQAQSQSELRALERASERAKTRIVEATKRGEDIRFRDLIQARTGLGKAVKLRKIPKKDIAFALKTGRELQAAIDKNKAEQQRGVRVLDLTRSMSDSQFNKVLRGTLPIPVRSDSQINFVLSQIKKFEEKGTLTRAPKLKTFDQKINYLRDRLVAISQRDKSFAKRVGAGIFGLGALGAVRGVKSFGTAVRHPVQFAKGTITSAIHPIQTFRAFGQQFTVDPVGTIAEFYTFSKTMGLTAKVAKRSPVGRFAQEELFIRAQPKEVRPYVRKIIKSIKVQERINPTRLKSLKKVDFMEVKSLSAAEAKALAKTLAETDSVVFGSLASRTISKKKTPIPKDVDIATKSIEVFAKKFIDNLPKSQRRLYKLKGEKVIRQGAKDALFDIKPIQRLFPDRSLISRRGWLPISGYVYDLSGKLSKKFGIKKKPKLKIAGLEIPTQKQVKVQGIRLTGFGEQTARKGLGTLQVLLEKNVRRAKDPSGFIKSLEIQLKGLKNSKPKTPIGKLRLKSKISKLESALRVLKSKQFASLLEKKVPGLLKEYPILDKINIKKLKVAQKIRPKVKVSAKKIAKKKIAPRKTAVKKVKAKKLTTNELKAKKISQLPIKKAVASFSRLPLATRRGVYSYLPKKVRSTLKSKVPSKVPSKAPSRVPSKVPSKIASRIPSRVPSKLKSKLVSRIPSKVPSKIPSKIPSKVPSRVPSKVPSKIPSKMPSKLPSKPPIGVAKIKPVPKPPIKIINWESRTPKGYVKVVEIYIKIGNRIKRLKVKTTPNRALRYVKGIIDNTTARSFQLKVVGLAKGKDIGKQGIPKFRKRKGKDPKVLYFVEKSKHAIDTPGEKIGLSVAKYLKKRRSTKR